MPDIIEDDNLGAEVDEDTESVVDAEGDVELSDAVRKNTEEKLKSKKPTLI